MLIYSKKFLRTGRNSTLGLPISLCELRGLHPAQPTCFSLQSLLTTTTRCRATAVRLNAVGMNSSISAMELDILNLNHYKIMFTCFF